MTQSTRSIPVPPDELIDRVVSCFSSASADLSRQLFLDGGRRTLEDFERALMAVGTSISAHERILDWGCGCARVTRWMEDIGRQSLLVGTDVDARAIAWASAHIPFARFEVNDALPPMRYADGDFDLVLNHSVFTHLDERYQDLWLAELRRVTAPGGRLVLTLSGSHVFGEILQYADERDARAWTERLDRDGILFIADDGFVGSAHPSFYHTTVHAPWYVFEHWSSWFEVLAYLPRGSLDAVDTVVLRRPADINPRPAPVPRRPTSTARAAAPPEPEGHPEQRPVGRSALESLSPPIAPPPQPSRFGTLGVLLRRGAFRVSRPVIMAQHRVDQELAQAIGAISEEVDQSRRMPPVVAAALYQQAERIGRVEQEIDKVSPALRTDPDALRSRVPAGVTPPDELDGAQIVDVETHVGPLFLHRDERVMTPSIGEQGYWELKGGDFLHATLRPGDTLLDIGANVGYMTILGARSVGGTGRVIAVEPESRNLHLLRANLWRNGLSAEVLPLAAYSRGGFITLVANEENRGHHQVREGSEDGTLVACARLDDILEGVHVDVAKIDMQGVDQEVLEGMAELVKRNPAIVVLSEFWLSGLAERGVDPAAVLARYGELGFGFGLLEPGGRAHAATAQGVLDACHASHGLFVNVVLTGPGRPRA